MPIEGVDSPQSPGWWLLRLSKKLSDKKRQHRLQLLWDYRMGQPPLPEGAENARESFEAFQRKARSNFAELITGTLGDRTVLTGFRTKKDSDETGDAAAARLWRLAGMDVVFADARDLMYTMSESYVIVGAVDKEIGAPVATAEDPRQMVGEQDPAQPRRLRAALKYVYDDVAEADVAYLYLPGVDGGQARVFVAVHEARRQGAPAVPPLVSPKTWSWDAEKGGAEGQALSHSRMPAVMLENKDQVGEFEPHLDLLDRINHEILQRMVIATMQAFRQRAVKGLPLTTDDRDPLPDGSNVIDYADVFTMDPAAIWQLPETAEMWESGQVDLTPILSATKDDIQHLSAVTRTPMHVFDPTSANQSAEGAALGREGLTFKARDRIARMSPRACQIMSLLFLAAGDEERAGLADLDPIWEDPDRPSLIERAQAAAQAADWPFRSKLVRIWGIPPQVADQMQEEKMADLVQAAAFAPQPPAAGAAGQQQTPSPAAQGTQAAQPAADASVGAHAQPSQ